MKYSNFWSEVHPRLLKNEILCSKYGTSIQDYIMLFDCSEDTINYLINSSFISMSVNEVENNILHILKYDSNNTFYDPLELYQFIAKTHIIQNSIHQLDDTGCEYIIVINGFIFEVIIFDDKTDIWFDSRYIFEYPPLKYDKYAVYYCCNQILVQLYWQFLSRAIKLDNANRELRDWELIDCTDEMTQKKIKIDVVEHILEYL